MLLLKKCLVIAASLAVGASLCLLPSMARAATCTISTDTVIDQAYIDNPSNNCSAINITENVSTTWIGTVDLQGSGTVTVKTTKTMTMGTSSVMVLGSDDDFVVETGAVVTHQAEDPSGVQITARDITIAGSIDAVGKGCRSVSNANGYGPDTSTGICTSATSGYGKSGRGGAAHGGAGGTGGSESTAQTTYDSATAPALLGSGGGGLGGGAGTGGGYVKIIASGSLTVNGTISVAATAGGPGDGFGNGGGSGGAILIKAPTISGSGSISANGGNGGDAGGGGGGGRVAIYYASASGAVLSNVTVARGTSPGGYGAASGGSGSAYFLDRLTDDGAGSLRIGGGFDFPSGDYSRDSITVDSGTALSCGYTSDLSLSAAVIQMSGSVWSCTSAISNVAVTGTSAFYATNTTWTFSNTDNVVLAGETLFDTATSTWTVSKIGSETWLRMPLVQTLTNFAFVGPINAGTASVDGGRLHFSDNRALSLVNSSLRASVVSSTFASLTVDAASVISVAARGCQGGFSSNGYGPNLTTGICTIATAGYGRSGRGGAAHGGAGGTGGGESTAQTATYGSSTHPVLFGSGGGQNTASLGAAGGGIIHLVVMGTLTNQGVISSDGDAGTVCDSYGCGAGSGGSIYVSAGSVAGSGSFLSRGGDTGAGGGAGGGGGGGRIAVFFGGGSTSTMTFSAAGGISNGGYGSVSGSEGTAYSLVVNTAPAVPSALGPTVLVNGSTTGTNSPAFFFTLADPDIADTVKYQIQIDDSSDFASPVVDYTSALAAQGLRSFQVGQAIDSGSYATGSFGQTLAMGSYYWRVRTSDLGDAASSYAAANSGAVAFVVDTGVRTIQFESVSDLGLESVTATSVRVVLDTPHFEDVTVNYAVTGGTATGSGEDYTLASGLVTILAGQTSTTIPLSVVDDQVDESPETLEVTLSSPIFASLGSDTVYIYTILDDDTADVTILPTSLVLSEGGASSTYTIVLTSEPTSTIQIALIAPADLTVSTTTATFTALNWNVPQMITVNAAQDALQEGTEVASITHVLTVPTGYAFGYQGLSSLTSVSASIADDESPSIALAPTSLQLNEGQSGTYTIVLGTAPTSTLQVLLSATAGVTLSTSTLTFSSATWDVPQVVTVQADNDSVYLGDRNTTITQTVSTTALGYVNFSLPTVSVMIVDDDPRGGGAAGSGAGAGGPISSILDLIPRAPVVVPSVPPVVSEPVPIIIIEGEIPPAPLPNERPREIITILNPTDILSLVQATQAGRDFEREARSLAVAQKDAKEFKVTLTGAQALALSNFITYGISDRTRALGEGERRALVRDALETMKTGAVSAADLERLTRGAIPVYRDLAVERVQLLRVRPTFRLIYGHDPDFTNTEENLAWNTLMYRIRFPRDLKQEQQGIREFKTLFNRAPSTPFQWATVRALGYVQK